MTIYALAAGGWIAMLAKPAHGETLTLNEAARRALAYAPTVSAATAQRDLNAAMVREARAPLYPSLSAGSEYMQAPGYSAAVTNGGLSDALLTLNYTAYDFGRQLAPSRAALYQSQAARYGVRTAQAQVVFDTTVAYYDLLRARETEDELRSNATRLRRYLAVTRELQQSGRAIANDVLKVETTVNSAGLTLATGQSASARASVALGALMGEFEHSDLSIAEVTQLPAEPGGDLSGNPMLEAARRTVEAAKVTVQAAIRERYPTLKLALSTGLEGINPPFTFAHNSGASCDGLVSMPIFDDGLISSQIDQAQAKVQAAQAQVRDVEFDLRRRLADVGLRYRQACPQLALLARAQPTATLDAYQQAEQLRLGRFDQEFAVRQAAAEGALILGVNQ
jgi:outer membrane protein